jgi:selenocysteine-specific elongation factor
MIVGTAGHIDHGKTTLVRALTGVDTDRLPEEKRRGISIELGYAYLDVDDAPGERIGFVDVPGHERLVATMLSGASGVDFALLLVAADDGVMPQTREHLAVLSLLGLGRGALVVTKADRASAARVDEVSREVRELVAGTTLAHAPLVVVSAATGAGIDALRALLFDAARETTATADDASGFRLAIDRVFSLAGAGTIVTGTAHAGRVAVGDELHLVPASDERSVRVRSIHAQNAAAASARGGQRVALGIVGIDKDEIERGAWLATPAVALSSARIDVRLTVWQGEARALRSGAIVHVHIGASDTLASVAVLDRFATSGDGDATPAQAIEPGASGRVQLVLRRPVAAWRGDRIVLRDASATRTIAGGVVLDPFAPARYRRTSARLRVLDAAEAGTVEARLAGVLEASADGVDFSAWRRAEGLVDADDRVPAVTLAARRGEASMLLSATHAAHARARIVAALKAYHEAHADEAGLDAARLRRLVAPRMHEAVWRAVLVLAVDTGAIVQRGSHFALPGHTERLSAAERGLVEKLVPRLLEGGFDPPWVRTLAVDLRQPEAMVRAALLGAARRGELHQVVKDLYYPAPTLARAAAMARDIAARDGTVTAAAFRDASGLGRKRAIQIVEYFDRVGLLRRVGDAHRVRGECDLFTTVAP